MPRTVNPKANHPALRTWAILGLLVLYALGSLQMETVHRLLHAHDATHTVYAEKDPCHRSLYHRDQACEHKTHVTALKKCPLCQFSFHADQWVSDNAPAKAVFPVASSQTRTVQHYIHATSDPGSSRAPPAS